MLNSNLPLEILQVLDLELRQTNLQIVEEIYNRRLRTQPVWLISLIILGGKLGQELFIGPPSFAVLVILGRLSESRLVNQSFDDDGHGSSVPSVYKLTQTGFEGRTKMIQENTL